MESQAWPNLGAGQGAPAGHAFGPPTTVRTAPGREHSNDSCPRAGVDHGPEACMSEPNRGAHLPAGHALPRRVDVRDV
jgi:hypothetical protein